MQIIDKDYCSRCKEKHEHMTYYSKNVAKDGTITRYFQCHKCANERQKEYYKKNPERQRAVIYKSIAKYPEKQKARQKLNYAVKTGKIIKPQNCSFCNKGGRIEADHEDYSKPLEVTWLCTPCHAKKKIDT